MSQTGLLSRLLPQVWRWSRQYAAQLDGEPLPEMQQVMQWLEHNIPQSDSDASVTRISHGDYKCACLLVCELVCALAWAQPHS